jgi:hypothetical protein
MCRLVVEKLCLMTYMEVVLHLCDSPLGAIGFGIFF